MSGFAGLFLQKDTIRGRTTYKEHSRKSLVERNDLVVGQDAHTESTVNLLDMSQHTQE